MKESPKSLHKTLFPLFPVFPFFLLLFFFTGCKNCDDPADPECKNYDPCYEWANLSADFEMNEIINSSGGDSWILQVTTGKVLNRRALELVAKDSSNVEHQWILGTDPRVRTGQKELLTFGAFAGTIEITHIVTAPLGVDCFADGNRTDTVTKTVEVISFGEDMPYYGTYTGAHFHLPDDLFSIDIYYVPENVFQNPDMAIGNFPNGCESINFIYPAGNGFLIIDEYSDFAKCWGLHAGLAQLSVDADTLVISYRFYDPDSLTATPPSFVTRESTFLGFKQ